MGVRGLQYFMKSSCPGGCKDITFHQLAETHRRKYQTQPVLAVDGMSCIRELYGDLCWVMSGQWREFVAQLKKFVTQFVNLGIHLVFFFDGTTVGSKRRTWVERRLQSVCDVHKTLEVIAAYGRPGTEKRDFQLPASMGTLTRYALKYECGCDVRTTIRECDEELIMFVRKNNCFAVLTNDSDLIVASTAPCIKPDSINVLTMQGTLYDRDALAQHLNIRTDQLPLLACLRGNDIVSESSLKSFHHQMGCKESNNIIKLLHSLAKFIRSKQMQDLESCMKVIAWNVFQSKPQVESLRKALRTYNAWDCLVSPSAGSSLQRDGPETDWLSDERPDGFIPQHDAQLMAIAKTKHIQCENPGIYSILCGYPYDSSTALEDQGVKDLPQCALLYRPIRQRTYSLLLGTEPTPNSPLKTPAVHEWCVYTGNLMLKADVVDPIPLEIPGGSPTLEQLWLGENEDERWTAFFACVGTTFGQEIVPTLEPHWIVFCCILNYLVQNTNIEAWELEAFVAQAVSPYAKDLRRLHEMKLSPLDVRAVQLGTIFMRGVTAVQMALGTCAHPVSFSSSMPWHFYDGKLFHECYIRAKQGTPPFGLCANEETVLQEFHQLMGVIIIKTRLENWSFW